jgi:hypothetical protein
MNDYDEFEKKTKKSKIKIPEAFHQEVKEYVGLQLSDEDDKYIGQTFNPIDNEDLMATNQLPNM